MADWQAIKTEYITTNTSYRKLAEKYDVSYAVIGKRAKKEGWPEERKQWVDNTTTKTLDALSDTQVSTAERLHTVTDKILQKIEAIVDAVNPNDMPAKSVQALTTALKNIKEIQGIKSQLDVDEQKARIANLKKQAEKDEDTVNTVEVVFSAGEEEWNE